MWPDWPVPQHLWDDLDFQQSDDKLKDHCSLREAPSNELPESIFTPRMGFDVIEKANYEVLFRTTNGLVPYFCFHHKGGRILPLASLEEYTHDHHNLARRVQHLNAQTDMAKVILWFEAKFGKEAKPPHVRKENARNHRKDLRQTAIIGGVVLFFGILLIALFVKVWKGHSIMDAEEDSSSCESAQEYFTNAQECIKVIRNELPTPSIWLSPNPAPMFSTSPLQKGEFILTLNAPSKTYFHRLHIDPEKAVDGIQEFTASSDNSDISGKGQFKVANRRFTLSLSHQISNFKESYELRGQKRLDEHQILQGYFGSSLQDFTTFTNKGHFSLQKERVPSMSPSLIGSTPEIVSQTLSSATRCALCEHNPVNCVLSCGHTQCELCLEDNQTQQTYNCAQCNSAIDRYYVVDPIEIVHPRSPTPIYLSRSPSLEFSEKKRRNSRSTRQAVSRGRISDISRHRERSRERQNSQLSKTL